MIIINDVRRFGINYVRRDFRLHLISKDSWCSNKIISCHISGTIQTNCWTNTASSNKMSMRVGTQCKNCFNQKPLTKWPNVFANLNNHSSCIEIKVWYGDISSLGDIGWHMVTLGDISSLGDIVKNYVIFYHVEITQYKYNCCHKSCKPWTKPWSTISTGEEIVAIKKLKWQIWQKKIGKLCGIMIRLDGI